MALNPRKPTPPKPNPVTQQADPARPVTDDTTFDKDTLYRVKLSGVAEYLGTPLSPMHVHTIKGVVASAIRAKIAAFEPA